MRWLRARWTLSVTTADEAAEALIIAGFAEFTRSTDEDGRELVECWGRDGVLPDIVLQVLGEPSDQQSFDEAELLAAVAENEPRELAPGWWVDPRPDGSVAEANIHIRLPPGPGFGDGHHPTTGNAVRLMQQLDWHGTQVLDLGCGSAVLAALAAQAGARRVVATDIDDDALRHSRAVAEANDLELHIAYSDLLDGVPAGPYDVIIANLYGELLELTLADPRLRELLPSGELLLSGISHRKVSLVRAAVVDAGFTIVDGISEGWWHGLRARRSTT
jgi:ribosomal protein L11 methylase PrmA